MKRKHLLLILIFAAVVAGAVYGLTRKGPARIELTGIVTTDELVASSQIAGRVESLLVKEGDTVKRGGLLAVIAPAELQADAAYYAHAEEGSQLGRRPLEQLTALDMPSRALTWGLINNLAGAQRWERLGYWNKPAGACSGAVSPRWPHAAGVATRPRAVRLSMPILLTPAT